jgi:hypothetical protein
LPSSSCTTDRLGLLFSNVLPAAKRNAPLWHLHREVDVLHKITTRGSVKSTERNVSRWHALSQSPPCLTMRIKLKNTFIALQLMGQVGESNFRDELEEVWVPKDVGELKGLLLTIQNEPGRKILKHKIQQALKERKSDMTSNYPRDWLDYGMERP